MIPKPDYTILQGTGKTTLGFEYDMNIPGSYDEAWAKDDALWEQQNPEEVARLKKEATNAKRRKTRAENKRKAELAKRQKEVTSLPVHSTPQPSTSVDEAHTLTPSRDDSPDGPDTVTTSSMSPSSPK